MAQPPRFNLKPRRVGGGKSLAGCGENELLAALLAELPTTKDQPSVIAGPGDDCAIIRPIQTGRFQLLKTDCVIEGIHFTPDTPPEKIGWKALCRPLSDIAAMGGEPSHALITLALKETVRLAWARGIYKGVAKAARAFGVSVVGGETSRSPGPCFISVCVTGTVSKRHQATRDGGKPGDWLYVTGRLGGSFASGRHFRFCPRLAEARWLVEHCRIRAMIDLSDGIAADLPRMAAACGTGYRLEPERVPRAVGCSIAQALGDGEDYELLFAIHPSDGSKLEQGWQSQFPGLRLTQVGGLARAGIREGLGSASGYAHFRAA